MRVLIVSLILFLSACSHFTPPVTPVTEWQAVYKHDKNGEPITGDIETLINGIRKGYSVRVGWGWEKNIRGEMVKLEHVSEPVFLTIIQESSVSIIIDSHPLLESYIDIENQTIGEHGHIWQCVLTTNGEFNAKVFKRTTGELLRDWPQRHTMTWFLEYPSQLNEGPPQPLYKSDPETSL